jgi:hypothetical protein
VTVLDREQFIKHWNAVKPGLGDPGSGLWAYEHSSGIRCQWFVSVSPIRVSIANETKTKFWAWCRRNCASGMSCYSASDKEEWWGFSDRQEMTWWLLRWSC